jgi:Uma2 family endonuclease
MSTTETILQIEYPESDGKPLGETDLHIDWIIRLRDILKFRYRRERVYVAADLILYFEEGNPRKCVVPDVFVVKDCDPRMRRTYLLWQEGLAPDVVIEVTSKSSKREDEREKPQKYAQIGVDEYFVYDPLGEYLYPSLVGFRRHGAGYERIEPNAKGQMKCHELGILLELDETDLVLRDAKTGKVLPTKAEAAEAKRRTAEAKRRVAEAKRNAAEAERQAAEERAAALEQELKRLREGLNQSTRD